MAAPATRWCGPSPTDTPFQAAVCASAADPAAMCTPGWPSPMDGGIRSATSLSSRKRMAAGRRSSRDRSTLSRSSGRSRREAPAVPDTGSGSDKAARVHDCGRRTWRHMYWFRPRWEPRLTSPTKSAHSGDGLRRGDHRSLRRDRMGAGRENVDALGRLVVSRIHLVEGVTRTLTCPIVHL
jgi:hypothetical protein